MKKLLYSLLAVSLCAAGCKKWLGDNEDPANPQVAAGGLLLPPIYANMALAIEYDGRYIGKYVQNFCQVSTADTWDRQGYSWATDVFHQMWRNHYYGIGNNIDLIIQDGEKNQKWDFIGAAKAIRAWSWQSTTDTYGEIIVKQAWQEGRYYFDYDSQSVAYEEASKLAKEAIDYLNRVDGKVPVSTLGNTDAVYSGDRIKWKRFAFGVLARNAQHLSKKTGVYNADEVIKYVDSSFTSNADDFMVPFGGNNTVDGNFWGPQRGNMTNFSQTTFIVGLMNGTVFNSVPDPRIRLMLGASKDSVYRGVIPTKGDPNRTFTSLTDPRNRLRIPNPWGDSLYVNPGAGKANGKYLFRDDAKFPIMTYAELQFIKAEAAFIKGDKVTALAALKKAVAAHIDFVNNNVHSNLTKITTAQRDAFVNSAAIPQNANNLTMKDILCQKYIALWGWGFVETWCDLRRNDYDTANIYKGFVILTPTEMFGENNGKVAQRVRPSYNAEVLFNKEALTKIGAFEQDYHTRPMWFSRP
ncbi:SusD/RagB family nutrient-binding outer membrane lipoprotein [Chitinophaga lutea]